MTVCVTGPMAAGKNLASEILAEQGFYCIDADQTAHVAIENAKEKILAEFGTLAKKKSIPLTNSDGTINRRNLGAVVFDSAELIAKQESIIYPEITRILEQFMTEHKDTVINATVLYKVPLIEKIDFILFIDCPFLKRFIRAKKRDKLSTRQILQRFKAQKNLFAKYKFLNADTVRVWNIGSRKSLESKILKIVPRR